MTWFWFAAMLLLGAVEGMTVTLVSIWFVGGALAAMLASLLGASVALQCILFVAVSAALLAALRPLVRRYLNKNVAKTNAEAIIGTKALVLERIDNLHSTGTLKVNGVVWTARSSDGAPIEADTLVRVDRIEGVKLFVSPAESISVV